MNVGVIGVGGRPMQNRVTRFKILPPRKFPLSITLVLFESTDKLFQHAAR